MTCAAVRGFGYPGKEGESERTLAVKPIVVANASGTDIHAEPPSMNALTQLRGSLAIARCQ